MAGSQNLRGHELDKGGQDEPEKECDALVRNQFFAKLEAVELGPPRGHESPQGFSF